MVKDKQIDQIVGTNIQINPIFHERTFVFDKKLVFVLMPFSEPWSDRIWEKLKSIIESKKLRAERADNRFGAIITEDIWTGIMEARLIICDTTGWNPNVFYELGISHTIGKPVILLAQPTHRLPFDTQGLRHLIYTDNPEGMRMLEAELPKWIDYCLSKKLDEKKRKSRKKVPKISLNDAWKANAKGYDPQLPPIKYQVLRSQIGLLRKRMKEYVAIFSEEETEQFLKEVKEVWPDSWDGIEEKEITKKNEEINEVINKWRSVFREKNI
jgi:hypothetical protein